MLTHANVERQPPEETGFGVLSVVVPEPEAATQFQLFSTGEPRTKLLDLQPSDEQLSDDLLGMYYLG